MSTSNSKPGGKKGGLYKPLKEPDLKRIIEEAFRLLERSGMHVYSEKARSYLSDAGAKIGDDGLTVHFPKSLVEDAISSTPSSITLCGRNDEHDVFLEDSRVYYGTGGTAINVIDLESGDP